MKYCLVFNGEILYGFKREHKKYKLWGYDEKIFTYNYKSYNNITQIILFETSLQAKLYLLQHSRFPKFSDYVVSNILEDTIDKIYLKGRYKLANHSRIEDKNRDKHAALLCEIIISEYKNG